MTSLTRIETSLVEEVRRPPTAIAVCNPEVGVLGSVVRLDGRASKEPDNKPLTYNWGFRSVPIGSKVTVEGFRKSDEDNALVTFSPDMVGEYLIRLTVTNGVHTSYADVSISIRAILVPDGRGLIPDGKFIWSYIRDIWQQVDNKEMFESFWSALIQICGAELLKAYQVDFNKSIRDIQEFYQRRWLDYRPKFDVDASATTLFVGGECVGAGGTSEDLGREGKAVVLNANELIVVQGSLVYNPLGRLEVTYSKNEENVGKWPIIGINAAKTGYRLAEGLPYPTADRIIDTITFQFKFQETLWGVGSGGGLDYALMMAKYPTPEEQLIDSYRGGDGMGLDIRVGDIIYYPKGSNAGLYKVVNVSGSYVRVDKPPPSASSETDFAQVYRPVGFKVNPPARAITNTFAVPYLLNNDNNSLLKNDAQKVAPGRLMVLGDQAFTILRSYVDQNQSIPLVVVTADDYAVTPDIGGLPWRAPHTLVSKTQNFEALGVAPGDTLTFQVTSDASTSYSEVTTQVVGVDRYRIGFEVTDAVIKAGMVPGIPDSFIYKVATELQIDKVYYDFQGNLHIEGDAAKLLAEMNSLSFARTYWNKELKLSEGFKVGTVTFAVKPVSITRNRLLPADETLTSIPVLQEWIVQPETTMQGVKTLQVKGTEEFDIRGAPVVLAENREYIIDSRIAYQGDLTFRSGTTVVDAEGADFFDKNIVPGDTFRIEAPPILAADYKVSAVVGKDRIIVSTPIPKDLEGPVVTAKVTIFRRRDGHFIRFQPGFFTPQNVIPERLWAEVSYFDNNDTIESNFGILVGLKREDLEKVSTSINYRQAVSGLMYAYTRGSALSKIRLGAQILLGLPFAEHRGIIRSIDSDYRLDVKGVPVKGRILVEDVDSEGRAMGTLRIYLYPLDLVSDLSGIETNPKTGKPYEVAREPDEDAGGVYEDKYIIELFSALAKGVEVTDYLTKTLPPSRLASKVLQQFHTFYLRANDNIFTLSELALVSSFLRKITPSYVAFVIQSYSEFLDQPKVTDTASIKTKFSDTNCDNISLGLSVPLMFDQRALSGKGSTFWDDGVFHVCRSGQDLTMAGQLDPDTHLPIVTSPGGGFLNIVSDEGPRVQAGDFLIIMRGVWSGKYSIAAVPDDTTLAINGPLRVGLSENLSFMVVRPIKSELRRGTASWTLDVWEGRDPNKVTPAVPVSYVVTETGLRRDFVGVGDWFLVRSNGSVTRHTIIDVDRNPDDSLVRWDRLRVLPPIHTEATGEYRIVRPNLIEAPYPYEEGVLTSDGTAYTYLDSPWLTALAEPLDEYLIVDGPREAVRLTILNASTLSLSPVLPAGQYTVRLCRRGRPETPIEWQTMMKFIPHDVVQLALVGQAPNGAEILETGEVVLESCFLTIDGKDVAPKPGDFLHLTSGVNGLIDRGYGPGVYPIVEMRPSSKSIIVPYLLTPDSQVSWKIVRTATL